MFNDRKWIIQSKNGLVVKQNRGHHQRKNVCKLFDEIEKYWRTVGCPNLG